MYEEKEFHETRAAVPDEPDAAEGAPQGAVGAAGSGVIDTARRLLGGDRVLWVIIISLMIISVLVVYSSTAKMAYNARSASTTAEFLRSQLFLLALCTIAIFVVHRINSQTYRRFTNLLFGVSLLLTLVVYFTGQTTNSAARWISVLGFQFQPSEMLKLTVVMYLANQLAKRQSTIRTLQIVPSLKFWTWMRPKQKRIWREGGFPIFLPIVLSCVVILPAHTSSAVLVFVLSLAMLYIGRVRWREIFRIISWAVVGLPTDGYRRGSTCGPRRRPKNRSTS